MLVWATEFPAAEGASTGDMLTVAKAWVEGSPHSPWKPDAFGDEPEGEITEYSCEDQRIAVARARIDGDCWAGFRHVWIEDDKHEWTTEIVGHEHDGALLVSIHVNCGLLHPGLRLPRPKKPYVVRQLLENLGGGHDASIAVGDEPVYLAEHDVDRAVDIVNGTLGNRLPIVYASARRSGEPAIDATRLAQWLSGMAHVVVEPSTYFSFALGCHVGTANAFGGAVAIYWPSGVGPQIRLLPNRFETTDELHGAVTESVRRALTHIRPTSECTWQFLREGISRSRISALRDSGSTELQEYIDAFDAEIAAKDARLEAANAELARLRAEVQRAEARAGTAESGVLSPGGEQPFYPGEIQDAIVQAMQSGRNALNADGRRRHIVDDLLNANLESDAHDQLVSDLKDCLSNTKSIGGTQRKVLERLGFSLEDSGKHIKAVYHGDERYTFSIPKTPSDHRSLKNLASEMVRTLFK